MTNSLSGGHSEKEKEHKERIKKLKAKTSKIRAANIYDEQEMNKDIGSASHIKKNSKVNRALNKRRKEMGLDAVDVKIAVVKKKGKYFNIGDNPKNLLKDKPSDLINEKSGEVKLKYQGTELSYPKLASTGEEYDYSRPAQLKLRLAAVTNWDEFDEDSAIMEKDMDMTTDENDYISYGRELEERYDYRKKNAPKKPSVSKR